MSTAAQRAAQERRARKLGGRVRGGKARDRGRGTLTPQYSDNIRRYVEEGGAFLVSAGPEMSSVESLNLSPMGAIIPGRPTGRVYDQPFLPQLTDEGRRHPVTAGLTGAPLLGLTLYRRKRNA